MRVGGWLRGIWFALLIAVAQAAVPVLHLHDHAEARVAGAVAAQDISASESQPDPDTIESGLCAVCSLLVAQASFATSVVNIGSAAQPAAHPDPLLSVTPPWRVAWLMPAPRAPPLFSPSN